MSETTQPIASQIETAVGSIPGWSPIDQLLTLFTLTFASANIGGDVLELGSWCGRSAVALGMAARLSGNTRVHCIDLFPDKDDWYRNEDGTFSFSVTLAGKKYGAYQDQTVWAEPYHRDIVPVYQRYGGTLDAFKEAMRVNGLSDLVTPYRADMETFAATAPSDLKLRLAFIDGDHNYDAVCNEIRLIERFLLPGGWICFDDAFSSYEGVNRAILSELVESGRYCQFQQMTRKLFVARKR
ncbi:class I SAM-dependent methyltransferase [Roseibium sediminis]|uniref:class I SAM-dependent methyltransferase n=1 Tax=Roseibium sediminis TaxID=1775174 RepID=UPI00123E19E0|nr:class I SAM-dependent methyltransferase [Roseibium sediminis]